MDDEELDDTVIGVPGGRRPAEALPNEDTVLRDRSRRLPGPDAESAAAADPASRPAPEAPQGLGGPPRSASPPRPPAPPALIVPPDRAQARQARDRRDRLDRRDDAVAPVPAPATWYRLSLDGAEPIVLDAPVLVGRDPRPHRVATGPAPRLVAVRSPLREVSATHLELRQDGASVIVTDMRSTNGTVITMPGLRAFTLHAGDSLVAVPGTLMNIGDSHIIEILPIQRHHARDQEPFEREST